MKEQINNARYFKKQANNIGKNNTFLKINTCNIIEFENSTDDIRAQVNNTGDTREQVNKIGSIREYSASQNSKHHQEHHRTRMKTQVTSKNR